MSKEGTVSIALAGDVFIDKKLPRPGEPGAEPVRSHDRGKGGCARDLGEVYRWPDGVEIGDGRTAGDEDEVHSFGGGERRVARVGGGVDDRDLGTGVARGLEDGTKSRGLGADDRGRGGLAPVAPGGG